MIINQKTAQKTASLLLQIKAIKLNSENPFQWASGWFSPIYCDNRVVLSHPSIRHYMCSEIVREIERESPKEYVIAGVASGAIGMGMLVAQALDAPFIYVRPEPKKHGKKNQIEGQLKPGQKVLVIEDLISTGKSSLNAVAALKEAGADVTQMYALFTYGFATAEESFKAANMSLKTLCDYEHMLPEAVAQNYISSSEVEFLQAWRKDPANWGR
ncbi:MAG: orotate phosphoribosyltransferase [Flavobacteriaceae bacterium]